jgi:hypothetical protein
MVIRAEPVELATHQVRCGHRGWYAQGNAGQHRQQRFAQNHCGDLDAS